MCEWNDKINVISRKDVHNLIPNHILPSIALVKLLKDVKGGASIMDVGTGGGFPGLPLAVCLPHVQFVLVDSVGKKVGKGRGHVSRDDLYVRM